MTFRNRIKQGVRRKSTSTAVEENKRTEIKNAKDIRPSPRDGQSSQQGGKSRKADSRSASVASVILPPLKHHDFHLYNPHNGQTRVRVSPRPNEAKSIWARTSVPSYSTVSRLTTASPTGVVEGISTPLNQELYIDRIRDKECSPPIGLADEYDPITTPLGGIAGMLKSPFCAVIPEDSIIAVPTTVDPSDGHFAPAQPASSVFIEPLRSSTPVKSRFLERYRAACCRPTHDIPTCQIPPSSMSDRSRSYCPEVITSAKLPRTRLFLSDSSNKISLNPSPGVTRHADFFADNYYNPPSSY